MNQEFKKILDEGDTAKIRSWFAFNVLDDTELIRKKFLYWSRWLLPTFFDTKDAPFHKKVDIKNIELYKNGDSFLEIGFRGCAKTNRKKVFIAFCIANDLDHYRKYFKILSKEMDNSKQSVTDIYNVFMRPKVRNLYPEVFQKTEAKREETMSSFTTATGIKMVADTIGTDQRGDIQDESRPDFVWFDDFETKLSLMSAPVTFKIWQNMEEAKNGLAKNGAIAYTCNYISERGNVHKLVEKIDNQLITPLEIEGVPTWPQRYTLDDIAKIKKEADDYEGEYQCKPSASSNVYFNRESIGKQIPKPELEVISGLKMFRKYDASHRIGSGHDVGGGVGLDSSTSVFMDFSLHPIQVIATYKDNEIKPDTFAYEIKRQAKLFGTNYIAPEKNYGSTIDILKQIYPTDKIHRTQRSKETIKFQSPTEYGWETNASTKPTMLADFDKAIRDGIIELNDLDLIAEAKGYTRDDFMDKEVDARVTTRHFDLLMAACICWQINRFVPTPDVIDDLDWPMPTENKSFKNKAR